MWGVVKGFQIDCNFTEPLGDLTGKGDQPSRKVVHRKGTRQVLDKTKRHPAPTRPNREGTQGCSVLSINRLLGDLTGTGDRPSGKVVLVRGAGQVKDTTSIESDNQRRTHRGVLVGQSGIVRIHITLLEISVKLDKRIPIVLRNVFT